MNERSATFMSFAVACSVPPFHLALSALRLEPGIEKFADGLVFLASAFVIFLPYSVLAGLIIGVPCYLFCRNLGIVTWWIATLVGGIVGVAVAFIGPGSDPFLYQLLVYVSLGAISGLVFWTARFVATNG